MKHPKNWKDRRNTVVKVKQRNFIAKALFNSDQFKEKVIPKNKINREKVKLRKELDDELSSLFTNSKHNFNND